MSGDEPSGHASNLDVYRETGHLILDGKLGTISVDVVITPYAQARMRRRDIDDSEVLEALGHPPSSHGRGTTEDRHEVAGMTGRGRLRVIYERPTRHVVLVITVYPESD